MQAAVDAGKVEEVTKLVAGPTCEALSKAQKKKMIKQAEITQKKLQKGGGAAAAAAPKPAKAAGKAAPAGAAPTPTPALAAVPPSSGTTAGASERALTAELLACVDALGLPADAAAALRAHEATLAAAIAPHVAAMRNAAYAQGFAAAH